MPRESIEHITERIIIPDHIKRAVSPEFRASEERLKADGHYRCWISGETTGLQIHHFGCEWSLANACNFAKLKARLLTFDIYGYSKLLVNLSITSVDDVRNMMVLAERYHILVYSGIHETSFPYWIFQATCQDGYDPCGEIPPTVAGAAATAIMAASAAPTDPQQGCQPCP